MTETPAPAAPPSAMLYKPRFALFFATACGLGYIPVAPGTFGSLAGLALAMFPFWLLQGIGHAMGGVGHAGIAVNWIEVDPFLPFQCVLAVVTGMIGVWSANRAANYFGEKDPQRVVIDEVSGQHLTLLLGCAMPIWWKVAQPVTDTGFGFITLHSALNWKYLLVGFILFRVFDIWKPFPARQAESLPGGWGIMADDWVAGIYAAMGLWIARAFLHL
jgi:phosphatidylglycerophosphatase A